MADDLLTQWGKFYDAPDADNQADVGRNRRIAL